MKYALHIILVVQLLFYYGCTNHDNLYAYKVKYVDAFRDTIPLSGQKIHVDNLGAETIDCIDSLLIFASRKSDPFYNVFSTNTYLRVGSFIPQGRSSNEMTNIGYPMYIQKKEGKIFVGIYDRANAKIRELDLTQSCLDGKTVFSSNLINVRSDLGHKFFYPINETTCFLHGFSSEEKNDYYAIYDVTKSKIIESDYIYRTPLPNLDELFTYNTFGCFNLEKQKYASAMQFFNQINMYSLKNKEESFSIVVGSKSTVLEDVILMQMPDKMEYYEDMVCTDDLLFALYANCSRKDWALSESQSVEIHVFDWNGTPLCLLKPKEKISKIAIDENRKIIYGMTQKEDVYVYDVSRHL